MKGSSFVSDNPVITYAATGSNAKFRLVNGTVGGYYYLQEQTTGLVLNVAGASKDNGAVIIYYPLQNGAQNEQFRPEKYGKGYLLMGLQSQKCMYD